MNFTIEQKEEITAYIARIIMRADICKGYSAAADVMLENLKEDAEKLKEYLMEIDGACIEKVKQ